MPHILYSFFLPLCLSLFAAFCENDDWHDFDNEENKPLPEKPDSIPPSTDIRRTVLMYVSAQNSLGYDQFHASDSVEISRGYKNISPQDRLLVYVDDNKAPRLYLYTNQHPKPLLVYQWKEDINSSNPATLQEVLTLVKNEFPASEYGLVMWSHSNGWVPSTNKNYGNQRSAAHPFSFGIDVGADGNMQFNEDKNESLGAQMDITDLAAAIKASGIHLQFIFFDSCLMQNLEVGYTLREVSDYIIGAPMQIPACGANYTHLLEKGLFTDAAHDIVETYTNDATKGFADRNSDYYDFGLVISSIRTDKLEHLAKTLSKVLPYSAAMNRTSANLSKVLFYQAYSYSYFYCPHNYDAQQAMQVLLQKEDYPLFHQALSEVIVNKGATKEFWIGPGNDKMQTVDLENYCGISIFVPQQVYIQNANNTPLGDLNQAFQATSWYKAAGWSVTGW